MPNPTRVAEYRRRERMSQVELAVLSHVSLDRVRVLENAIDWEEIAGVRLDTVTRLAKVFKIAACELVPKLAQSRGL